MTINQGCGMDLQQITAIPSNGQWMRSDRTMSMNPSVEQYKEPGIPLIQWDRFLGLMERIVFD